MRSTLKAGAWIAAFAVISTSPAFGAKKSRAPAQSTANTEPAVASSPIADALLNLPAFDLETVDPAAQEETPKVGDPIRLRLSDLPAHEGAVQVEPLPGTESLEDQAWEVTMDAAATGDPAGAAKISAIPLKSGTMILPSLVLKDSAGRPFARTNPFSVKVASAIPTNDPKPDQPADLRPPVGIAFPWWVVIVGAIVAIALVAAIVYGAIRYSRRAKGLAAVAPQEPQLSEDEEALAALSALEKSGHLQKGEFKKHYFRVSDILKSYIGRRYGIDALESTTREMLIQLEEKEKSGRDIPKGLREELTEYFLKLDRVKFTDQVPESGEAAGILPAARQFVLVTKRSIVKAAGPHAV